MKSRKTDLPVSGVFFSGLLFLFFIIRFLSLLFIIRFLSLLFIIRFSFVHLLFLCCHFLPDSINISCLIQFFNTLSF